MPFSWSDARIERQGASRLRVRAVLTGDWCRLDAVDESGAEVVSVAAITFRPVDEAQLEGGRRLSARNSLFTVDWTPVQGVTGSARVVMLDGLDVDALELAVADRAELPEVVVAEIGTGASAQEVAERTLGLLQPWSASEPLAASRLVVLTRRGIAAGAEAPDLAVSPVWGLVRSAQSEHPGGFLLVDSDTAVDSVMDSEVGVDWASLAALDEPQLAVRD